MWGGGVRDKVKEEPEEEKDKARGQKEEHERRKLKDTWNMDKNR